jgi:hypothetical protein
LADDTDVANAPNLFEPNYTYYLRPVVNYSKSGGAGV